MGFDPDTDYSALMNEYLNKGGVVGDATYNELLRQRNLKIDWLQTDAGGNKGRDYWGTYGDETTAMYNDLMAGNGDQEWFTKDYVADEELAGIFEDLGVPLGALEEAINAVKAATDTVGEKVDATKENITQTSDKLNAKIAETGDKTNAKITETSDKTDTKIGETGDKTDTKIGETGDNVNEMIESTGENTIDTLGEVADVISTESGNIQSAIGSAASEVASSVGGAFNSMQSEISSLRSTVTGMAMGAVAGPIGTAIGGVVGSIIGSFDSGGYTGDWGPEGKLAMLHEKELVLNATDTENLLSTVDMVREIAHMIDMQANMASIFNLTASAGVNNESETLEQTVTIHAEFPNATNHNEIEEAFNNLVNRASQYANRK